MTQPDLQLLLDEQEIRYRAAGDFESAQQTQRLAELLRLLGWCAGERLCSWFDRGALTDWRISWTREFGLSVTWTGVPKW